MKKNKEKTGVKKQNSISKEDAQKVREIIKEIEDDGRSEEFKLPVDFKTLGLDDYPTIIKNPMDISTRKLKNSKYQNIDEILNDIQLIWDNCKNYNTPGSEIFNMAADMENVTKKSIDKILKMKVNSSFSKKSQNNEEKVDEIAFDIQDKVVEDSITYNEKNDLCEKIKKLTSNDIFSLIVEKVNLLCQKAIENLKKDHLQIRIDKFDRKTYEEVNKLIDSFSKITEN